MAEAKIAAKSKALRIIAIIALVVVAAIVILSLIIFPRMQDFFLKKGLEYARQKTMAVLPAVDGYNPDVHPYDPLIIDVTMSELKTALDIDTLSTDQFRSGVADFMESFRRQYDDQIIMPEEVKTIAASLDTLQRTFLRQHFAQVQPRIWKLIEARSPEISDEMYKVLGFDSAAIYNPEVKLGLTGAYSVKLVNEYYLAMQDGEIVSSEYEEILNAVKNLDRFQLRDELRATAEAVFKTKEFSEFENSHKFRENTSLVLDRLRDTDYDYQPIKPTLRSFIYLWYLKARGGADTLQYDVKSMFEMTRYAAGHAARNQTSQ
ncbi:MAG TPA: hypothetical protein ENO22_10570 [candidate division Zixibacteria bacterium]|nr:hypothetical protein [candidate division Zixibacteria bacterium]